MFKSRDDAMQFITSQPTKNVSTIEIVDEDTGEIYISVGQKFGTSNLCRRPSKRLTTREMIDNAEYEYYESLNDYASSFENAASVDEASAIAQDAHVGFFAAYPKVDEWMMWLDLDEEDIIQAVNDIVFEWVCPS